MKIKNFDIFKNEIKIDDLVKLDLDNKDVIKILKNIKLSINDAKLKIFIAKDFSKKLNYITGKYEDMIRTENADPTDQFEWGWTTIDKIRLATPEEIKDFDIKMTKYKYNL